MSTASSGPKTVLETILEWSRGRSAWQRDALRRIVSKGLLDTDDHQELVELCKQGKAGKGNLTASPLEKKHLPANPDQGEAVSLVSVADVAGVNNLAAGQTLTFEQGGMTVIYGDNGAGKSGYARILKRACRARYPGKIEPNIYGQQAASAHASGTITYSIAGTQKLSERWRDNDRPHATLSAISVFDSDCASVHIREKNEVAFCPFGLDVPDELVNACHAVRNALVAEQGKFEKARNPLFERPSWKDTTAVGKALAALKHDTDLKKIDALAKLTDEEADRLARLRQDISKNPIEAAAEQRLRAENIKRLLDAVHLVADKTTDQVLMGVASAADDATAKREAARLAAEKAFSGEPLKGVGGDVWRVLWNAARRYSTEVAYPGQQFPPSAEYIRCVLCQQPLDAKACDRMARFEEFIQKDTERQATDAEKSSRAARQALAGASISTRPLKTYLQEVALRNAYRRNLADARKRRVRRADLA